MAKEIHTSGGGSGGGDGMLWRVDTTNDTKIILREIRIVNNEYKRYNDKLIFFISFSILGASVQFHLFIQTRLMIHVVDVACRKDSKEDKQKKKKSKFE